MSVNLRFKHDSAGNPSAKVVESQTNASLWGRHSHFIRPKAQGPRGRGTAVGLLTNLPQFTMFCGFPHFYDLVDQDGSTWRHRSLKMRGSCGSAGNSCPSHPASTEHARLWTGIWPNIAPRWPNLGRKLYIAPRWANIAPSWANIARRRINIAPYMMAPSWSKRSQNSRKLGQLCPNICLRQTLVGFWPAVGCEPLNPAKGSSAVRPWQCRRPSLLSVGEKGCDPYHRPYKHTAIDNVLWLSPFFRIKMGQHGPT